MVEPMRRFQKQLAGGMLIFVAASLAALQAHRTWHAQLPNYAFISGWVLFGFMVMLTLFNARKKLPFLPLARSETWLQIHIYGGFFTVILFLIHLNFRPPRGGFDITLTVLFGIVTVSGIVGLVLSRVLPRRLKVRGGEVLYEKIPAIRHALQVKAETLALGGQAASPIIAEFYSRRLAGFFAGPQNFWQHLLLESSQSINELLANVQDLRRLLSAADAATLDQLALWARQKDGLDYHHSLQTTLKLWLFVHLPFTYLLMLFTFWHIVVVFAFSGGAQ
jgi:hypothetical protein